MLGISKKETFFLGKCLENDQYFLTKELVLKIFPEISKEALYQMIYRLRKKELLFSMMNGQYLICPINEWLKKEFLNRTFKAGILSYLSSIGAVITGSTAVYFYKYGKLPEGAWEVTTLTPLTRSKTLLAGGFSQKLNFHYSKKIFDKIKQYKIKDLLFESIDIDHFSLLNDFRPGHFGVETIDFM